MQRRVERPLAEIGPPFALLPKPLDDRVAVSFADGNRREQQHVQMALAPLALHTSTSYASYYEVSRDSDPPRFLFGHQPVRALGRGAFNAPVLWVRGRMEYDTLTAWGAKILHLPSILNVRPGPSDD